MAPSLGTLIAAVLLPPLGVYLARGLGPAFWIAAVLTLIGWIPGAIFALVTIPAPQRHTPQRTPSIH